MRKLHAFFHLESITEIIESSERGEICAWIVAEVCGEEEIYDSIYIYTNMRARHSCRQQDGFVPGTTLCPFTHITHTHSHAVVWDIPNGVNLSLPPEELILKIHRKNGRKYIFHKKENDKFYLFQLRTHESHNIFSWNANVQARRTHEKKKEQK